MPTAWTTRRQFLIGGAVTGLAILASACAQQPAAPAAAPTNAPAQPAAPAAAPAAPTTAPGAAAAPASTGPVTVIFHQYQEDDKDEFWGPVMKKFADAHPNIKVDRQWFPYPDITPKQLALAATNQIGDMVCLEVAPYATQFRIQKVIQPLDELIKGDKTWATNEHPQFWPANIATYTQQGQQWGYPFVGHPGGVQHYFNIDYLNKVGAGLPPVDADKLTFDYSKWTLDDLQAILKKATTKSSDGRVQTYPIRAGVGGEGTVALLRSFGGNYYSDDGTKSMINTPESIAGIEYLANYFKSGESMPLSVTDSYTTLFPAQQVAFLVQTCIAANLTKLVGSTFKWSVAPPPKGPSGKAGTQVSSNGKAISRITKHPAETWELMKHLMSKDVTLGRYLAGLGSPGSRYDVWTDPAFLKGAPALKIIYDNLVDPTKAQPMGPWSNPANGTWGECDTAYTNLLRPVYDGQMSAKDGCAAAFKAVQAIMDRPVG